jgi:hypothetical protein
MTTTEIVKLLENAIDYNTTSEYHTGYSAKEIHRKCLFLILRLEMENKTLKEQLSFPTPRPQLGWGKGKDE